jgi:hypothetical protein
LRSKLGLKEEDFSILNEKGENIRIPFLRVPVFQNGAQYLLYEVAAKIDS